MSALRFGAIIWLTLLFATPLGSASGDGDFGVVAVSLDNGQPETCDVPLQNAFCAVTVTDSDGIGDDEVDAYQRLNYAGVATNFSSVEDKYGFSLLPDQSLMIKGSDVYIHHPLFQTATDSYNAASIPSNFDDYVFVTMSSKNITIFYLGPTTHNPLAEPGHYNVSLVYGDSMVGYDRLGPVNELHGTDSDAYLFEMATGPCIRDYSGLCKPTIGPAVNSTYSLTPMVRVGLDIYDVEVATDPSYLRARDLGSSVGRTWDPLLRSDADGSPSLKRGPQTGGPGRLDHYSSPAIGADGIREQWESTSMIALTVEAPKTTGKLTTLVAAIAASIGVLVLALIALYSRFSSRRDALHSPKRQKILATVTASPGTVIADIARTLNVQRNAVMHHLHVLERTDLVRMERTNGRVAVYPAGRKATIPTPAIHSPVQQKLLKAIRTAEVGLTRGELHEVAVEVPVRTRNDAIRKLVGSGLIVASVDIDSVARYRIKDSC